MDVLRFRRPRLARRLGFLRHLYRPDGDGGPGFSAADPHRAARQGPEHHLDRRFDRGALRQEPGGGGDRGADRHRRHGSLYRAAAQSGVVVGRHHLGAGLSGRRAADRRRQRAVCRAADGGVRGAVRHPSHRRHRASGRVDAGDRDRVDRQAGGVPRRRHFRDLRDVSRAAGVVHPRARPGQYRGGAHPRAAARGLRRDDGAVAVRHRAVAAPIPCRGGREPQRGRDPPRRLAVPDLSGAHQSVRAADRHGGPADVPRRKGRQRHVRAGAADRRPFRIDHARRLRRRPVGGDRHGDRGIGGARHHGVERHRGAAGAQAPGHARRGRAMPAPGC